MFCCGVNSREEQDNCSGILQHIGTIVHRYLLVLDNYEETELQDTHMGYKAEREDALIFSPRRIWGNTRKPKISVPIVVVSNI